MTEFLRLLINRVGQAIIVVTTVTTMIFFLMHLAPGNPYGEILDNPGVTQAIRQQWIEQAGLDRPVIEQYWRYLTNVAQGEFGWSFSKRQPVIEVIQDTLPYTLLLTSIALLLGFAGGIVIAVMQAQRAGSRMDRTWNAITVTLYSIPDFLLALITLLALSYWLPIFPVGGAVDPVMHDYLSPWGQMTDRLKHLALPVLTLSVQVAAILSRFQRAELLRVLPEEYIQTARAKGVSERRVVWRHALRTALLPTVSEFGLMLPLLFTGAVFVEKVFSWPGMGWTIINAVSTRDYPLVTASVIVTSAVIALGSLIADLLYPLADPRVVRRQS